MGDSVSSAAACQALFGSGKVTHDFVRRMARVMCQSNRPMEALDRLGKQVLCGLAKDAGVVVEQDLSAVWAAPLVQFGSTKVRTVWAFEKGQRFRWEIVGPVGDGLILLGYSEDLEFFYVAPAVAERFNGVIAMRLSDPILRSWAQDWTAFLEGCRESHKEG